MSPRLPRGMLRFVSRPTVVHRANGAAYLCECHHVLGVDAGAACKLRKYSADVLCCSPNTMCCGLSWGLHEGERERGVLHHAITKKHLTPEGWVMTPPGPLSAASGTFASSASH
jgi:hypothetical protein